MTDVLVATDADWVFDEVDAALGDAETTVHRVRTGAEVRPFVKEHEPDLVVLDLQIGNMGGIATCLDLRLEAGMGRLAEPVVLMLLDRQADVFLARRSEADGWLVKPLDSIRVHAAGRPDVLRGHRRARHRRRQHRVDAGRRHRGQGRTRHLGRLISPTTFGARSGTLSRPREVAQLGSAQRSGR